MPRRSSGVTIEEVSNPTKRYSYGDLQQRGRSGLRSGAPHATPVRNPPQPAASHSPPPAPVQGGGSMLNGIGSTIAQGMAFGTGSAVAHRAVDSVIGPRTIEHEVVTSQTTEVPKGNAGTNACDIHSKAFQDKMSSDDSDYSSDEREFARIRCLVAAYTQILITTTYLLYKHGSLLNSPASCMTSKQTGDKWVGKLLLGSPVRFHNTFKMSQEIFLDLLHCLEKKYGFKGSRRSTSREVFALTLYILSRNESMRQTCGRFKYSTETASRFFARGIRALVQLANAVILPPDMYFNSTPPEILYDTRYMPFFKDCIGAIDGIHVDACIKTLNKTPYIGRHGKTTQNVMAACDFNMCFTFVMAGWEGSAHDSHIFNFALNDPRSKFPHPPPGKYYLVDADYPLQRGYLKPYSDTRYHLSAFAHGSHPVGHQEVFNQAHSSLRSVIERSFGVWKKKWAILRDMPNYNFEKQADIVFATMALHNFIRRHPSRVDIDFSQCERMDADDVVDSQGQRETCNETAAGVNEMIAVRESIAHQLYAAVRS